MTTTWLTRWLHSEGHHTATQTAPDDPVQGDCRERNMAIAPGRNRKKRSRRWAAGAIL